MVVVSYPVGMGSWRFILGTITTRKQGKGGGSYNISNGNISHPPAGSGKAPKIKTKQRKIK